MKIRYESFGGIIRIENPPATIYVDKNYMKEIGYNHSDIWNKKTNHLSAPIDVHFALTNKCPLECKNCYKSSSIKSKDKLSLSQIKKIIDVLSNMGVFSIAFGGGEPFARQEIFEIAEYARKKGIVPNITTNGYYINKEEAKKCKVFGHIHISLDFPDESFDVIKSKGAFKYAKNSIEILKKQGISIGINCVISRKNFDSIGELIKFCKSKGIKDICFLRFKPAGRSKKNYEEMKLTNEQNIKLFPLLKKLIKKYKVKIQIDCSLTPMVCYHKPNLKLLDFFGAQGCEGGNTFIEIKEDGKIRSCSFSDFYGDNALNLNKTWENSKYFNKYREVSKPINYPCTSCKYLKICRGGCHVISEFMTGKFESPDPECPIVVEYNKKRIS